MRLELTVAPLNLPADKKKGITLDFQGEFIFYSFCVDKIEEKKMWRWKGRHSVSYFILF